MSLKSFGKIILGSGLAALSAGAGLADVVHNDDVIVDGSICAGTDCANNEVFGDDTLRLDANKLRIHFDDTSFLPNAPANDWRILINDIFEGGDEYFAIHDSTAGNTPFRIEAGAPTSALYVDESGNVGINEDSPLGDLHISSPLGASISLDWEGAGLWSLSGSSHGFSVGDAANGLLPSFSIVSGAPIYAMRIDTNGNVGLGTSDPDGPLHILDDSVYITLDDDDHNDQWFITHGAADSGDLEFTSVLDGGHPNLAMVIEPGGNVGLGTGSPDGPLHIANNNAYITLEDTGNNDTWYITHQSGDNGNFEFTSVLNGSLVNLAMSVQPSGNMIIDGALTQNSDKNAKTAIEPIDPGNILAKVAALPISSWSYKHDDAQGIRHIGPMAQDFYSAFGTGADETGISTLDMSGVSLAAVKALAARAGEAEDRANAMQQQIETLSLQIEALSSLVGELTRRR